MLFTTYSPLPLIASLVLAFLGTPFQSFGQSGAEPPVARPTGQAGFVHSPFEPEVEIDVTGLIPGTLAVDPNTNKTFRIPVLRTVPTNGTVDPASEIGTTILPEDPEVIALRRFLEAYLYALGREPDDILEYYSVEVTDHFGTGPADREAILQQRRKFHDEWPVRRFRLLTEPMIGPASDSGRRSVKIHFSQRFVSTSQSDMTDVIARMTVSGNSKEGFSITSITPEAPKAEGDEEDSGKSEEPETSAR